jgi:predicted metalloendopeptidase
LHRRRIRKLCRRDDLKLNGRLTLGENTADNGGARIALMALREMVAADKSGKASEKIDGFTPEQRFFLGFGRVWCEKRRPELARTLVNTDPHSPGKYRVNGVVQNMPEFQQAWGCKTGKRWFVRMRAEFGNARFSKPSLRTLRNFLCDRGVRKATCC